MKSLLAILLTIFLFGCAPGAGDYEIKLPNDYLLNRTSANQVTIDRAAGGTASIAVIPPKVVKLTWNDRYILTKQLGLKRRSPNDEKDTYEIPDETKVYYWILQEDNGKLYGPLSDNEFSDKKKELSIPDNLVLKEVSSYDKSYGDE